MFTLRVSRLRSVGSHGVALCRMVLVLTYPFMALLVGAVCLVSSLYGLAVMFVLIAASGVHAALVNQWRSQRRLYVCAAKVWRGEAVGDGADA